MGEDDADDTVPWYPSIVPRSCSEVSDVRFMVKRPKAKMIEMAGANRSTTAAEVRHDPILCNYLPYSP